MYSRKEENIGGRHLLIQLGNMIKKIRADRKMSQMALAELCGFQKATMSKIESGLMNITMATLKCITDALGVSVGELLSVLD